MNDDFFKILADFAFELSPERMALLAEKANGLNTVAEIDKIRKAWGPNVNSRLYTRFVESLDKHPEMTGRELKIAFEMALAVVRGSETKGCQELLWTGPTTSAVPVRQTEQALCELIQAARRKLFIVSFVAYKANSVINALSEAIARNIQIGFLLEPSKEQGGMVDVDSAKALKKNLPSADFYVWEASHNPSNASIHAKCAIADEDMALITSANLTSKAMDLNMELGVLIRNGNLPKQLAKHFEALIHEKIIVPKNGMN